MLTLFLEGAIPVLAAIFIWSSTGRHGKNRTLNALAWLLLFSGLFSIGLSLPSLLALYLPGFVLTVGFVSFVTLACHASLYVGLAGYVGAQCKFVGGRKAGMIALVASILISGAIFGVQLNQAISDISRPQTSAARETAHDEAAEGPGEESSAPGEAGPSAGVEASETPLIKYLVLGYLGSIAAFILGLFLYQAYQFRRVKSVLTYTVMMSLGIASLIVSWILREVTENARSAFMVDAVSFLSLGLIIAGVYFHASRYMSPGFVYDTKSKKPISLAVVRVFALPYNKLVESRVSDKNGRYGILAEPGTYLIDVTAAEHTFPSKEQVGYHKEEFVIDKPTIIGYEIPMDPAAK